MMISVGRSPFPPIWGDPRYGKDHALGLCIHEYLKISLEMAM